MAPRSTHCNPLRNAMPGMAPVDLWTTLRGCLCRQCVKPGLPTTPQAHHQRKEGAILFSVGRVLCRMTRFRRGTLPLAYAPGVEQERSGQITSYKNRTG